MSRPAGPHAKEIHAEQWREIKTTLRWPVCAANINVSSKGVTPNHPNLNIYFGIEPVGNRHFRYCWRWQLCCFVSIRTHSTDEADTSSFEKNCRTDCPDGHANSQFTSLSIIFGNAFEKKQNSMYATLPAKVVWMWYEYGSKLVGIAASGTPCERIAGHHCMHVLCNRTSRRMVKV